MYKGGNTTLNPARPQRSIRVVTQRMPSNNGSRSLIKLPHYKTEPCINHMAGLGE